MKFNIIATPNFKKELKRLAKKYPSLKFEFTELIGNLEQNPKQGIEIGNHCYKIRIAIASKGKGKSGGGRVITFVQIVESNVFLISIYDKSEQEKITAKELLELVREIK
ncbi:MAG: type II toxin-antitoxin system RelE/ParE family toxin [Bacteroidota bacterium]